MNHANTPTLSILSGAEPVAPKSFEDAEAVLTSASDDDLELALRLVAWNTRDLGQFLKARTAR